MAGNLLEAGFDLTVTTRTRARAEGLLAAGGSWADTPAEVAADRDVVFSMVGFPADVREVLLGPSGALSAASAGTVLVDMTTSEPSLAVHVGEQAAQQGVHVLDAPVSGGDVGARNGTLSIMVGGPTDVFEAVRPCFDVMGTTIARQGDHGAGQHTKMVNQILVASTMVAMSEGLAYAYRVGLDVEQVLGSVAAGAAGSWSLSNLAPRVVAGDFAPGFLVDHLVKDSRHRPRRGRAGPARTPGPGPREPALRRAAGPGSGTRRDPGTGARPRVALRPQLATVSPAGACLEHADAGGLVALLPLGAGHPGDVDVGSAQRPQRADGRLLLGVGERDPSRRTGRRSPR